MVQYKQINKYKKFANRPGHTRKHRANTAGLWCRATAVLTPWEMANYMSLSGARNRLCASGLRLLPLRKTNHHVSHCDSQSCILARDVVLQTRLTDMSCCACFSPLASAHLCSWLWWRLNQEAGQLYVDDSFLCCVQLWPGTISLGIFGQINI